MATQRKAFNADYNTKTVVKGSTITITCDLSKEGRMAKSGASIVLASAQGGLPVNGRFVGYSLNAYASLSDQQKAAADKATFDAAVNAEIERRKAA